MSGDLWQLFFIDALFLCLAGGLGLWFRHWLQGQRAAIDRRLERMDAQRADLERLSARLQGLCRLLELRVPARGQPAFRDPDGGSRPPESAREGNYARARALLGQGVPAAEVSRRVGLGIAEVEVLRRMLGRGRMG